MFVLFLYHLRYNVAWCYIIVLSILKELTVTLGLCILFWRRVRVFWL